MLNGITVKFGRPLVSMRSIRAIMMLTQFPQSYDTWFVFLSTVVELQLIRHHGTGLQSGTCK